MTEVKDTIGSFSNNMNSKVNKKHKDLPDNLRLNGKTPSGKVRLFVCSICTRAFARQEHLTRHERSHTKEKPYCCGLCQRKFSRRDLLLRHAQKIHNGDYGDTVIITSNGTITLNNNERKIDDSLVDNLSIDLNLVSKNNKDTIIENLNGRDIKRRKRHMQVRQLKKNLLNDTSKNNRRSYNSIQNENTINGTSKFSFKRRSSFSAQSATEYVIPRNAEESNHKIDNVKFSTPEMLPINYFKQNISNISSDDSIEHLNLSLDPNMDNKTNNIKNTNNHNIGIIDISNIRRDENINSKLLSEKNDSIVTNPDINIRKDTIIKDNNYNSINFPLLDIDSSNPFSSKSELNLLDTIEWINGKYNSSTTNSSSNSSCEGTSMNSIQRNQNSIYDTEKSQETSTNEYSKDFTAINNYSSKKSLTQKYLTHYKNADNGNIIPTLFKHNESFLKKKNGLTNSKFDSINGSNTKLNWNKSNITPSSNISYLTNTTENKFEHDSMASTLTDKLSNINLNEKYVDLNIISDFTSDIPSIFGDYLQTEESKMNLTNYQLNNTQEFSINNGVTFQIGVEGDDMNNNNDQHINPNCNDNNNVNPPMLNGNYTFYGLDYVTISNITRASPPYIDNSDNGILINPDDVKLFTPELHKYCTEILDHYKNNYQKGNKSNISPMLVAKELVLPSCKELNNYLSSFMNNFAPHHSFIHPDILKLDKNQLKMYIHETSNDSNSKNYEKRDEYLYYANLVCLPLFMATCGSFFRPGCKPKNIELYEISRRILHVYLERRKQFQSTEEEEISETSNFPETNAKPHNLWLIQSLILSVVFALFEDQNIKRDDSMIKRQITAVCSIVRKNIIPKINVGYDCNMSNNGDSNSFKFKNQLEYIIFESSIRCVLMVYNFCNHLKIFYHMDSSMFLNEADIENIVIPDREDKWLFSSFLNNSAAVGLGNDFNKLNGDAKRSSTLLKQYYCNFHKFYGTFAFNNIGIHQIPDVLIKTMLYYEFNSYAYSNFHLFLHKIDTKKLEKNFEQNYECYIKTLGNNFIENDSYAKFQVSSILQHDGLALRNSLMVINLFNKVDRSFCSKIWKSNVYDIFEKFLSSKSTNLLTNGSYNTLTDFLVALNFSIKNITKLFKVRENATIIDIDKKIISLFSLQSYYYDFLVIIKFIIDFEYSPNFKLLCIYTELKKLADKLLIPKFYSLFPEYFVNCPDVISTFVEMDGKIKSDINHHYLQINSDKIEKIINNILVYAFNDSSFLIMSEPSTNEFLFNNSQPPYYPFASSSSSNIINSNIENVTKERIGSPDPTPTKSAIDLLISQQKGETGNTAIKKNRQDFYERYKLSLKYVVISKCFFEFISRNYIYCHFIENMIEDIKRIEENLELYNSK
ncbi:hypothetical protein TPHA_0C02160 [Tetrapisispora phaffii CBS 4417]|uniref:C2H2-type domain-containing protein n=1 Tax=Tetrapisispora phaffii (strain ATCC 24235 / CBS 4417 / NBRC 1672 / NRRL Y-8282 / UCD 70-5) TaxID=1071381 RepID=G8BRJ4_TETPH|nr:hypothetical protein TPHA_0C02160 [Tetrapisispora phaffii CBS 4417]CCE62370.1 hypothetical protein TPHA_0C02160 [Tetrapisispora phaffii CBS 4417]